MRGAARQPSMASYSRQFVSLCFCLNGKMGIQGSEEEQTSYIAPGCGATGSIHATTPQAAAAHLSCARMPSNGSSNTVTTMPETHRGDYSVIYQQSSGGW